MQAIQEWMKKYGPVMRIALGERETVSSQVLSIIGKSDIITGLCEQPYRIS